MNCRKVKSLLIKYIEKELNNNISSLIEEHLMHCKRCSELYNSVGSSFNTILNFRHSNPEVSFFFTEKVIHRISSLKSYGDISLSGWLKEVLLKKTSVIIASATAIFTGIIFVIIFNTTYAKIQTIDKLAAEEQTIEDVYLAATSNDYILQFFENQK